MRVARLDSVMAWAEDPPSRTRHLIGNLEAAPLANGEVEARTAFLVYRSHLEADRQLLSGCREDVLRKVNGAWKVARRTIVLEPTSCSTRTSASSSKGRIRLALVGSLDGRERTERRVQLLRVATVHDGV